MSMTSPDVPTWVTLSYLYQRDEDQVERARQKLSRALDAKGWTYYAFHPVGEGAPPWLGMWNAGGFSIKVMDVLEEHEQVMVLAHEFCHALLHPTEEPPASTDTPEYKREDRIAHGVGEIVGSHVGIVGYPAMVEKWRISNHVPLSELASDERAEATRIADHITQLIARTSVWPIPTTEHICNEWCADKLHAERVVIDEVDEDSAVGIVRLALEPPLELVRLERWVAQRTPRTTEWRLYFALGSVLRNRRTA